MIQQYPSIFGTTNQQLIKINLTSWLLLAKGQGHIILKNNDQSDPLFWRVLMICIHDIHTAPTQFETTYFQILKQIQNIGPHLLQRQEVKLQKTDQALLKKYVEQQLKIFNKISQNYEVFLADNLNRSKQGWQYSFQFKPKTPLPDKYSRSFLNKFGEKYNSNVQTLANMLDSRPTTQKIRWFKKNCLKQNKKNMNPLQIFNIINQQSKISIKRLQTHISEIQQYSFEHLDNINKKLFEEIKKSSILLSVLKLQLLFTASSDSIPENSLDLWSQVKGSCEDIQNIKKKIVNEIQLNNINDEVTKLFNSSVIFEDKHITNKMEAIFRFLISWSWRDISLFVRIKVNHQNNEIEGIDFKIIDYQLKQSSRLIETVKKDWKFLQIYSQYLTLQSNSQYLNSKQ